MNLLFPLENSLWCLVSFLASLLIHIIIWRGFKSARNLNWLIIIFIAAPSLIYLGIGLQSTSPSSWALPLMLHFLLAANYIAIYPAFQASSPTIQILNALFLSKDGLSEDALFSNLASHSLMMGRVEDLKESGLIRKSPEGLLLTRKGRRLASLFILYRSIIRLPQGNG